LCPFSHPPSCPSIPGVRSLSRGFLQKVDNVFESFFKWLESTYKWFLSVILKNWKRQSLLIGLVFVSLVFALYGLTTLPSTLYPAFGDDIVTVRVELPPGSRLEATKEVMSRLELLVREEIQGIENLLVTSGNRSNFGLGALNSNRGSLTITLPPIEERIEDSEEIKRRLRAYFNSFPGATLSFGQNQRGLSGDAIDLVIKSEDLDAARDYATQVQELIKRKMEEMTEPSILEPTVNFTEGAPQSDVRIDRERGLQLRPLHRGDWPGDQGQCGRSHRRPLPGRRSGDRYSADPGSKRQGHLKRHRQDSPPDSYGRKDFTSRTSTSPGKAAGLSPSSGKTRQGSSTSPPEYEPA
jgi:multidrug efflux pump subunit AcrB